ncbi:MAG: dihydroorotase [Alphaproteobacteria bacterium]|nr:dihydroorotase [Alphaproteobacteria bacterium]
MTSTLFKHVRMIDPASNTDMIGECLIEHGKISQISDQSGGITPPIDAQIIDGNAKILAPGLIDMRVQSCHPGAAQKETPLTLAQAAARGGVTSIVCLPNTNPVLDDPEMLKSQCRMLAGLSDPVHAIKVYAYGAATSGLNGESMAELGLLSDAGAVGFTNATHAISNSLTMRRVLSYAAMLKQPVIQHAEDPVLAAGGEMHEGEHSMRLGLKGIPDAAEEIIIARDLALLRMTGGHYHVAHISTAKGIALIRAAKAEGLHVTCDTAPPYALLNDIAVRDYDSRFRLSPPLRHENDRLAVLDGLADGTIDAVASDHSPQDRDVKSLPFGLAEPGYSGIETLLALMLTLYHGGHLSLMQVLALTSYHPAQILGLSGGQITVGAPADLALIDIDRSWQIRGQTFASLSGSTPFEGAPVQGRVLGTWVDGTRVFDPKS